MEDFPMRADRLISILLLLQNKGRMTAHDLALQLEVSERTIYRDLEALSIAGIPVYTERGPNGGCSLLAGYQTRLTGLTDTETQALFLSTATTPLADLGMQTAFSDALLKLQAALPEVSRKKAEQIKQRIYLDTSWWHHQQHFQTCLQTLQTAVLQEHKLFITYFTAEQNINECLLEPYGLVAKADVWYLIGYSNEQYHTFNVAYIRQANITPDQFHRDQNFDLTCYWEQYCKQIESTLPAYASALRLAPEDAPYLTQILNEWGYTVQPAQSIEKEPIAPYLTTISTQLKPDQYQKPVSIPQRSYSRSHIPQRNSYSLQPQQKKYTMPNKKNGFNLLISFRITISCPSAA
jgi:predicted DNA-binding transcriptional regulator YafY